MSYTGREFLQHTCPLWQSQDVAQNKPRTNQDSATQYFSLNIGQSEKNPHLFVVLKEAFKTDVIQLSSPFPGMEHRS